MFSFFENIGDSSLKDIRKSYGNVDVLYNIHNSLRFYLHTDECLDTIRLNAVHAFRHG